MYVHSRGELGQVLPAISAGAGLISPLISLFAGKKHYSPWGFLYDEYLQRIWDNETQISAAIGAPEPMGPRPIPRTDTPNLKEVAKSIVSKYVPGAEAQIDVWDRRLNEPGGAFEIAYQKQLAYLAQLTGQPAPAMPPQSQYAAVPVSAQTAIPSTVPIPPRGKAPYIQAGMLPDLGQYGPLLLVGGAALLLFTILGSPKERK